MALLWRKHRLYCPNRDCQVTTWTNQVKRIASINAKLTTRAAKWATKQVGCGRTVSEVATELGCDWHTVNDTVTVYGQALLEADHKRLSSTNAIGLDETKFVRTDNHKTHYATTVRDVENHQIIDIVPSRKFNEVAGYLQSEEPFNPQWS